MKVIFSYTAFFTASAAALFFSCTKQFITYPSEPAIEYKDFIRYGNPSNPDSVSLVVSFTDNEGDIDLTQADTQGVFKYGNFVMVYYYDSSGYWAAYDPNPLPPFDTIKFFYRVPHLSFKGNTEEPMKGVIYAKQYPFINPFQKIKYKVYMYDKAMHKSNVIETPPIQF